jgi:hypothetical protein
LWRAFPRGETVDFGQAGGEKAGDGGAWDPEWTVRGEVIRALLLSGPSREGEIAALRVKGARISGLLDLRYGIAGHAVGLRGCHFDQTPISCTARVCAGST